MVIIRDDITLHFHEDDGSVVLTVKDVDVVTVVLHGFWNGADDYFMAPDDVESCPTDGFMVASWVYDSPNLEPHHDPAENGEFTRLFSSALPIKDQG